jgi:hypothetical protein
MGHWNHRVVKRTSTWTDQKTGKVHKEPYYRIEECFYDEGKKLPRNMTDGNIVQGESIKDLEWVLKHMLKCLKHPVLNGDKFK